MRIRYVGPLQDYSGYGQAARHDVLAMMDSGVEVDAFSVHYTTRYSDFGKRQKDIEAAITDRDDADIRILHLTPDQFPKYHKDGKYHIGRVFWETDKIPDSFARGLECVDEIWTGSEANKEAVLNAGVKKPIYIIPQAIDTDIEKQKPFIIPEFDGFLFYSIFEWTERKNAKLLLESYYSEFTSKDNVALLLKTYHKDFGANAERMITSEIRRVKAGLGKHEYPKVLLYTQMMDRDEIFRLHETGDAFISTHRGEGWGVPQVEATLFANPVISTGYGGCHEYYTEKAMIKLPYEMTQVRGMDSFNSFYTKDQKWAQANAQSVREAMRKVHEDSEYRKRIGRNGKATTMRKFALKKVGDVMKSRLEEISKTI